MPILGKEIKTRREKNMICCVDGCKAEACTVYDGFALCHDHFVLHKQREAEAIAQAEQDKNKNGGKK